ncbi:MAG: Tungstate ABC transporter, permease protein, partial [uncultured Microvirga sp.]
LRSMRLSLAQRVRTLIYDTRFSLLVAVLAAFGRAISEVGAVLVVGGNIAGSTRTMTTAISLETQKGDLPLALALGFVLIGIVIAVNGLAGSLRGYAMRAYG